MNQRVFITKRTNRRVAKKDYEGKNKRKGLGRRRPEKYSYYAYVAMLSTLALCITGFILFIIYNLI